MARRPMDKKTLPIVIVLVLLVIFYPQIWGWLGLPQPEPQVTPDSTALSSDSLAKAAQPSNTSTATLPVDPNAWVTDTSHSAMLDTTTAFADTAAQVSTRPDTIVVETKLYRVVLSTIGGGPVAIDLKEHTYRDGTPVRMIPEAVNGASPDFRFAAGSRSTSQLPYQTETVPGRYDASVNPLAISYRFDRPGGGAITKRYTFLPDSYHFNLAVAVDDRARLGLERGYQLIWNNPLGVTEPDTTTDLAAFQAVAMQSGSRITMGEFNGNQLNQSVTGTTDWAAVRSKYFAAAIMPSGRAAVGAIAVGEKRQITTSQGGTEERLLQAGIEQEVGLEGSFVDSFRVFVGPMDHQVMASYKNQLDDLLDIGTTPFVGWIIKPFAYAIIWLLPILYAVIPNYGLVIILFAILVKLITMPLSIKSMQSMNAMKEMSPKLESLKERYKNDPARMNQEMMKLYKESGFNPLSGCLPILPQIPLFIAMSSVFTATIVLRNAPFVGFITDLSHHPTGLTDPYILIVVLMMGGQLLSSWLTMSSATQQNKIFMFLLPLMMGFIFYRLPAALALYWAVFSLLSLVDWYLFRRKNTEVQGTAVDVKPKK